MDSGHLSPPPPPSAPDSIPRSFLSSAPSLHLSATPPHPSPHSSAVPSPCPRTIYSDRFIPSRAGSNLALFDLPTPATASPGSAPPDASPYCALLSAALFGTATPDPAQVACSSSSSSSAATPSAGTPARGNIFRFKAEVPRGAKRKLFAGWDGEDELLTATGARPRKIPRSPYKILNASALQDDPCLNLLDWSSHNLLAVGLGNCVHLWNSCTNKVSMLCDLGLDDDIDEVCSVGWAQRGTQVAIGTEQGKVHIWDANLCKRIRTMENHQLRVGSLSWSSSLLSSGSQDKTILHHDIRAREDYVGKLDGHQSEVCGLRWSPDSTKLASGGTDKRLLVWVPNSIQPLLKYTEEHTAAVRAIAWSPHQPGLLASGGGAADTCVRFWNTTKNTQLSCMETGSQVCNIVWSNNMNELVTTHGDPENQIAVWRYPSMVKVATMTEHTSRALYLTISPAGQNVVTSAGGGDETLRFWNMFPSSKSRNPDCLSCPGTTSSARSYIR